MILTMDIGTTTLKASLFDTKGNQTATVSALMSMVSSASDCHESDPLQWCAALDTLCKKLDGKKDIQAIVISGNGPTLVPVIAEPCIEKGMLIAKAGMARLWLDRRAVAEAAEVSRQFGSFVDSSFSLPKALYLKRHEPSLYGQTKYFLASYEYFNFLLTGQAKSVLFAQDAERWYWNDAVLEKLGLDKTLFPPFCAPGDLIGKVSALAAAALGLPEKTPVFAGGPDFFLTILGTGTVEPGQVCDRSGTSEGINLCTVKPLSDNRLMTYSHPIKPYHNISGIISTSGKAIEWAKNLCGCGHVSFDELYAKMALSPPGAGGVVFLPYLTGERAPIWDPDIRGIFSGLNLSTGQSDLLRSVAEGVCFAIRDVITAMQECGGDVNQLRITGGPSQSAFLNQLKADVSGREVLIPKIKDAELLGCLVLACTSLGLYSSWAEAATQLVQIKEHYMPNLQLKDLYADLFCTYRATYSNLKCKAT